MTSYAIGPLMITVMAVSSYAEDEKPCRVICKVSPRSAIEHFVQAYVKGDAEAVVSAFDLSSDEGRKVAELIQAVTRFIGALLDLRGQVEEKFGEEALADLEEALEKPVLTYSEAELRQYLRERIKVYIGEDGETAVAYLPRFAEEYSQWKYHRGRWVFDVTEREARLLPSAEGFVDDELARIKLISQIVEKSNTRDECRKALEALPRTPRKGPSRSSRGSG